MLFLWIFCGVLLAVAVWLAFFVLLARFVGKGRRQKAFLIGSVPSEPPEGFYHGTAYLLGGGPVPWLGKSFHREKSKGFNVFTSKGARLLKKLTPLYKLFSENEEGNTDAYFFHTSTGPGFKDKGILTFKLDYDLPENPFLIRIILDEIVQTAPQTFLGKVHVKVFPGFYATIGFFGLSKDQVAGD